MKHQTPSLSALGRSSGLFRAGASIACALLAAIVTQPVLGEVLHSEDFETDGQGSRYTSGVEFNDGVDDHYGRTDGSGISNVTGPYTGMSGTFFFATEDSNGPGGGSEDPRILTISGVDISGFANVTISGLFGAGNENTVASGFEGTDRMRVFYEVDGGGQQNGVWFSPEAGTNQRIAQDTDFDGVGDGSRLGTAMQSFSFVIPSGSLLNITIELSAGSTSEELAFDNILVNGDPAATDPPVLSNIEPTAVNYTEGDAPTQVSNTITVSDPDSTILTGAIVQITANNMPAEDVLAATGGGGVTVMPYNAGTGMLSFTGNASPAAYQAVLRTVTYQNKDTLNPNTNPRTVSFQVTDDQSNNSNPAGRNIDVANNVQTFSIPHLESFDDGLGTGDRYEVVGGFDVGQNDFFGQLPLGDASIRFSNSIEGVMGSGFFGGEGIDQNGEIDGGKVALHLDAAGLGNLSVDVLLAAAVNVFETTDGLWVEYQFDGGTWNELIAFRPSGVNTSLSQDTDADGVGDGAALTTTLANYNLSIPDTGNVLKVRVRALTGTDSEEIAFDELSVNGNVVGASPVLSNIAPGPRAYTEGDGAVVISSTATITDTDDADMESATVAISANYVNGEDVLSFTPSGGITGTFDSGTGILSLSGGASKADYQTVLQSVTYENSNLVAPNQNVRIVTWRVNDGDSNSNGQTSTINVLDVVLAQSLPFCESFENDGLGTRYSANTFNIPPDFFERTAASFGGLTGANADGIFAFGGKDTGADGNSVHSIEITVDTSGATDLKVDLKLAAVANQFETSDTILIEAESDGGGFVRLTSFHGSGINSSLSEDTDNNGTGDGTTILGSDYTDHNYALPDANETRIRLTMNSSVSTEEFAVDNICVTGTNLDPPVADLADPLDGGTIFSAVLNSRGYIDVTFTDGGLSGLDPATITDVANEMSLSGAAAAGVTLNGEATLVSGTTYRYAFTGSFVPGAVTVDFPAGTFADLGTTPNVAETEGFAVLNSPPDANPDTVDRHPTVSVKIPVETLLANDSDPDTGDNVGLTVTAVNYTGGNGANVFLSGGIVFYDPLGYQGVDTFEYTLDDSLGATSTGIVTVNPIEDGGPTFNITGVAMSGGDAVITGAGIPGRAYRVQFSPDLASPITWTTLTTVVADGAGQISYTDPGPLPPTRFYRVVHP